MKKINLGTLRSIELFSEEDETVKQEYKGVVDVIPGINEKEKLQTIGSINEMYPLVTDKYSGHLHIASALENKLILVASGQKEWDSILNDINEIWSGYESAMFLPRTPDIMQKYKELKEKWKQTVNDNVDVEWWYNFAFKELNVHYKL
jgi:hypothetical protein